MTTYRPLYSRVGAGPRWIFSYADMMTILLVLFVAISAKELRKIDVRPRPAPRPAKVASPEDPLLRAQRILEQRGLKPRLDPRGVVVSVPQAILFASGDDQVSYGALPTISRIAEALRGIPNKVSLIGNADDVPIHNRRFRDNWVLSVARGLSLLEVLSKRFDVPQSRLSVAGNGSYSPREPNDTADNRAANRRVEIVLLREPAP